MVMNNVVDAAAVDSNVLQRWMLEHHQDAQELHVMCSWGPWPVQPIVVNSRLPSEHFNFVCALRLFPLEVKSIYDVYALSQKSKKRVY